MATGNVVPINRRGALDQPMLRSYCRLLSQGAWCHIFPEGKVRQTWRFDPREPKLGDFKVGVGKLIAHADSCPIVVPIYHTGMQGVIPEVVLDNPKTKRSSRPISYLPRGGNTIRMYVGRPLDFSADIAAFRRAHPGALDQWRTPSLEGLQLYQDITEKVRRAVLALEYKAHSADYPYPPLERADD